MVQPRYLIVALLLLVLTVAPSYVMPNGLGWAYAETLHGPRAVATGSVQSASPVDERTVATSNENEQKDKENRKDHGNNANDNNENENNNNGNQNTNGNSNDDDSG